MPRAAILRTLLELLGPLGPFGSPEEREAEEDRWISRWARSGVIGRRVCSNAS